MKKIISVLLTVVLVAGLFAGCSTGDGKILKMGLSGISGLFNPIMADNTYDDYVVRTIFESLVDNDDTGEYVAQLADYKISDDKLTYTFTLKDGIKFSDGTAMTAADVEFTYLTMADPDYTGPRAYAVSGLLGYDAYHSGASETFDGIKVIDEKNISFTFPDGSASPANIQCFIYGIMPKAYYAFDKWEDFIAKNATPMGSGVMKFDSYEPKQYVKVLKNDKYWDTDNAAKIDGVLFSEVPDESILGALQTKQIDFAQPSANADNVAAVEAMDGVKLQSFIGNGYTFMCFNTTIPALSDVRVRQALMYALDRKSFIKAEYGSEELASVGMAPISPASWAYPEVSELNAYDFDMTKAAALMDEAGWKMGTDGIREKDGQKLGLSWLVYTESTWPQTLSSMAADTWKQLGVDLKIELMDFDSVAARTMDPKPEDKDFDVYTMGFSLDVDPDPTGALYDYGAYTEGGFNASGYYNEESQNMIAAGKKEFDTEKRAAIYKEWAKLMNTEIPTVIIANRSEIWGVSDRVSGMEISTYRLWVQCLKDIDLK